MACTNKAGMACSNRGIAAGPLASRGVAWVLVDVAWQALVPTGRFTPVLVNNERMRQSMSTKILVNLP